jgi:hypothetical protein
LSSLDVNLNYQHYDVRDLRILGAVYAPLFVAKFNFWLLVERWEW